MGELDLFFGIMGIGCGLYCLYSAIMMKRTGVVAQTLLLDKETAKKKCKNVGEFIVTVLPSTIILGIITTLYGVVTLIDAYVMECATFLLALIVLTFIVLIWFAVVTSKAKKKYYD